MVNTWTVSDDKLTYTSLCAMPSNSMTSLAIRGTSRLIIARYFRRGRYLKHHPPVTLDIVRP